MGWFKKKEKVIEEEVDEEKVIEEEVDEEKQIEDLLDSYIKKVEDGHYIYVDDELTTSNLNYMYKKGWKLFNHTYNTYEETYIFERMEKQ